MLGIYPVLIELKNRSEESFVFGPQDISVPMYNPLQMACIVPVICVKSFFAAFGGALSLCGGILAGVITLAHAEENHDSFVKGFKKSDKIKVGSASTLALFYLGIKGLMYGHKKQTDRKKDQGTWLDNWMLQPPSVGLNPNIRVKKFIFLNKKTYQKGVFRLTLNAQDNPDRSLSFDVSLLP